MVHVKPSYMVLGNPCQGLTILEGFCTLHCTDTELLPAACCSEVGLTWLHEPCREMLSYGLISEGIPERLHPKSFRSTFELNTHVWATRQQRYTPYVKVCCCFSGMPYMA